MTTLVARLAAPLQSWGADPRFRVVATHPTPTWSGLLGLCRAALGHGRDADMRQIEWLRNLAMAVRVDQPGRVALDFHTINPLPVAYLRFRHINTLLELALVTKGKPVSVGGTTTRWDVGKKPAVLVTQRAYLHDAAFTWFTEGPHDDVVRLAHALTHPRWALALGRKSCPPSAPLVLGLHEGTIGDVAGVAPILRPPPRRPPEPPVPPEWATVPLIHLTPAAVTGTTTVVMDAPLGAHPQHGYARNVHTTTEVTAPVLRAPWDDVLTWAEENLTRPHLEDRP